MPITYINLVKVNENEDSEIKALQVCYREKRDLQSQVSKGAKLSSSY